jgi:hypothetical protein
MASGNENRIGAHLEGLDDQIEIDAARAREANDADIGRIVEPVRAS